MKSNKKKAGRMVLEWRNQSEVFRMKQVRSFLLTFLLSIPYSFLLSFNSGR